MTAPPLNLPSETDQSAIREQLARILASGAFAQSQRRQRFLAYVVEETLAGRGDRLKGYSVGVEVFDRPTDFDPAIDPIVRIEAGRLRDKLHEYYETEGQNDTVRIELPKGSYVPTFEIVPPARPDARSRANSPAPGPAAARTSTVEPPVLMQDIRGMPRWMLAGILAVIAAAGLLAVKGRYVPPSHHGQPAIAVLPLDNLGEDPKWDRLADGMTEDIITDLASNKALTVIARNSTAVYKGKPADIRRIGRELGVSYVLEGTIQPAGERIRVTAQLIETATGSHVWSERYDEPADALFTVQNEVTQRIAHTLGGYQGAVVEAERSRLRRNPPASLTAFDTYLLGLEAKHKVTKDSLAEAEVLLNKALELDPTLARAHSALVDVQSYLIDLGLAPSLDQAMSKMMRAGQDAVRLDPNDGKAHVALGSAYAYQGKREQALAEFAKAEALAPSDADALLIIAWMTAGFDDSQRVVGLAERALKLNPHHPDWYNQGLSYVFFFGGQFERSVKHRLLVKEPLALDYAFLAMANAHAGVAHQAKAATANVTRLDPSWNAERYASEFGGYAEKQAELLVDGARKAGLPACIATEALKDMPNIIRVKSCDEERARRTN